MARKAGTPDRASPVKQARNIPPFTKLQLFVRAAGRCEFPGCNKPILEHELTLQHGNFAEVGHIVAFAEDGPRGNDGERPAQINAVDNLMLLCAGCHHLIDTNPEDYPRGWLEAAKRAHEARIALVTGLGPELKTSVVTFSAPIGGQRVSIAEDAVPTALLPRYPASRAGTTIDLNDLVGVTERQEFLALGSEQIAAAVARAYGSRGEVTETGHASVFALGPIPLLVQLGAALTSKVPTDLYQHHRDTQDWTWKTEGEPVQYRVDLRREGAPEGPVGLLLALSGTIPTEALPEPLQSTGWLYEVTLEGRTPDPTFLKLRSDLDGFKAAYQQALGLIAERHGLLPAIDLIPAIPAPIAVACGRERLPKVHPALRVYDFDRNRGGYNYSFEV